MIAVVVAVVVVAVVVVAVVVVVVAVVVVAVAVARALNLRKSFPGVCVEKPMRKATNSPRCLSWSLLLLPLLSVPIISNLVSVHGSAKTRLHKQRPFPSRRHQPTCQTLKLGCGALLSLISTLSKWVFFTQTPVPS